MSAIPSARHTLAIVLAMALSFRWVPLCLLGLHRTQDVAEVWGWRRFCHRCGRTLEVGR